MLRGELRIIFFELLEYFLRPYLGCYSFYQVNFTDIDNSGVANFFKFIHSSNNWVLGDISCFLFLINMLSTLYPVKLCYNLSSFTR